MPPVITNLIRLLLDEIISPFIRDLKIFMYPLYFIWFRGNKKNINTVMDFKNAVFSMSREDLRTVYARYRNLGSTRATDAFPEDYAWVLARVDQSSRTLLDVGCGNGFWLEHVSRNADMIAINLFGMDIGETSNLGNYTCGEIETLPFADKSFDVVTCFFVLEHIKDLHRALGELKRIARRQLFLAVPCQRYYKYTFDLHVHFFYSPEYFKSMVGLNNSESQLVGIGSTGHILYYANMEQI